MWHVAAIDENGKTIGIFPNLGNMDAAACFAITCVAKDGWHKARIYTKDQEYFITR